MDLGQILDAGSRSARDIEQTLKECAVKDTSGDYVLPVPFSLLQKELQDSVIKAHYADVFAYFDPENESERSDRSMRNLSKMKSNLNLLAVHPYLVVEHYLPDNLPSRELPHYLSEASGTFSTLGMLAWTTSDLNLNVGIVSRAGKTADLLDQFLADKPVNYCRYSGTTSRETKYPKAGQTTFHLVPSHLRDLTKAVNAWFDFLVLVDDSFDTESDYGSGLRAQLRDPNVLNPFAPVLRLVPLDSIVHAELQGDDFKDSLAAAITLQDKAGAIPRAFQPIYDNMLSPLKPWFRYADGPWPLPRPTPLKKFTKFDVERALMEESLKKGVQNTEGDAAGVDPPAKRLRSSLDSANPGQSQTLSHIMLEKYNVLLKDNMQLREELASLCGSANGRQYELEMLSADMKDLILENRKLRKQSEAAEQRVEKIRSTMEKLEKKAAERSSRCATTQATLDADSASAKYLEAESELQQVKLELEEARNRVQSQAQDLDFARRQFQEAVNAAAERAAELETVVQERDKYQKEAEGNMVKMREVTLAAELKDKDAKIAELQALVQNYKVTLEFLQNERSMPSRERSRYTNRANGGQALPSPA